MSVTIGVDVGGTKCLGVLLDDGGAVLHEHRLPTPRGSDAIVQAVVDVTGALRHAAGTADVAAVGVGLPGLVDRRGSLRFAPNLPGVSELPVGRLVSEELGGMAVRVENDASCAAWGEREAGAARGAADAVLVTLGTGIGGGIIAGGALYRGANGFAGEVGHMVVDPHGPPCPCGKRGCWERFASGSGLGRLAREAAHAGRADRILQLAGGDAEDVRGEHVTAAAAEGDAAAEAVMAAYAWWLALGLANLANVFDPEVLVLGGGLVEAGPVLVDPVRAAFAELVEAVEQRPEVRIEPAQLGEHAGAIGAARLARGLAP